MEDELFYEKVSRVEIIGSKSREYVNYIQPGVRLVFQDEGRTLKIFVDEKLPPAIAYMIVKKSDHKGAVTRNIFTKKDVATKWALLKNKVEGSNYCEVIEIDLNNPETRENK